MFFPLNLFKTFFFFLIAALLGSQKSTEEIERKVEISQIKGTGIASSIISIPHQSGTCVELMTCINISLSSRLHSLHSCLLLVLYFCGFEQMPNDMHPPV